MFLRSAAMSDDTLTALAVGFAAGVFAATTLAIYIGGAFHLIGRAVEKRRRQRLLRREWVRQRLVDSTPLRWGQENPTGANRGDVLVFAALGFVAWGAWMYVGHDPDFWSFFWGLFPQ